MQKVEILKALLIGLGYEESEIEKLVRTMMQLDRSEILQFGRYIRRYIEEHGKLPTSLLFMFDQFILHEVISQGYILSTEDMDIELYTSGRRLQFGISKDLHKTIKMRYERMPSKFVKLFLKKAKIKGGEA